ncbi:MAG: response regulator, partial [Rhodobacterales bacterium]|nr:response regulator [Rhodobacterales bacterium]
PGVPVAMQAQIFERFTQVDMSETRQHEGTGIGLALVKSVAELHGGTVELASVPGQGACFVVLLPGVLTEQEPAALIQTGEWTLEVAAVGTSLVSERPRTGRALVLVVDDNADLREFVANLVYRTYDVVTSVDGLEALGLVKELEPALILSDLMMPRMSGQDLLRAVRELEEPVSQTPVILLTAKTQEEARLSALGAGADDYLHKPFTDQELMVRVRNQLDRRTHILEIQAQNQQLSQTLEAQVAELLRVGKLSEFVPEALRRALAEPTPNGVAFTRERLTCMFIDLVGYTALSERLEPEDLANLLNGYLCEITAEATLHRAVVDKFIGDAVMILFRASDHEDPAAQVTAALKVATGAHRRVAEMGPKWGCELQVRVGFETGMVTVGVFGSEVLRSMTAVGPTINLASRLQGACPPGSTYAGPGAQRAAALDSGERVVLKLKNIQSSVKVAVL